MWNVVSGGRCMRLLEILLCCNFYYGFSHFFHFHHVNNFFGSIPTIEQLNIPIQNFKRTSTIKLPDWRLMLHCPEPCRIFQQNLSIIFILTILWVMSLIVLKMQILVQISCKWPLYLLIQYLWGWLWWYILGM